MYLPLTKARPLPPDLQPTDIEALGKRPCPSDRSRLERARRIAFSIRFYPLLVCACLRVKGNVNATCSAMWKLTKIRLTWALSAWPSLRHFCLIFNFGSYGRQVSAQKNYRFLFNRYDNCSYWTIRGHANRYCKPTNHPAPFGNVGIARAFQAPALNAIVLFCPKNTGAISGRPPQRILLNWRTGPDGWPAHPRY